MHYFKINKVDTERQILHDFYLYPKLVKHREQNSDCQELEMMLRFGFSMVHLFNILHSTMHEYDAHFRNALNVLCNVCIVFCTTDSWKDSLTVTFTFSLSFQYQTQQFNEHPLPCTEAGILSLLPVCRKVFSISRFDPCQHPSHFCVQSLVVTRSIPVHSANLSRTQKDRCIQLGLRLGQGDWSAGEVFATRAWGSEFKSQDLMQRFSSTFQ